MISRSYCLVYCSHRKASPRPLWKGIRIPATRWCFRLLGISSLRGRWAAIIGRGIYRITQSCALVKEPLDVGTGHWVTRPMGIGWRWPVQLASGFTMSTPAPKSICSREGVSLRWRFRPMARCWLPGRWIIPYSCGTCQQIRISPDLKAIPTGSGRWRFHPRWKNDRGWGADAQ